MDEGETISVIVGENVRQLRTGGGHTGDALARELRRFGKWNSARVSDLEKGRVSPTIPTLFILTQALGTLLRRPVMVAELLDATGWVSLGFVAVRAERITEAFDGKGFALTNADVMGWEEAPSYTGPIVDLSVLTAVRQAAGEAEMRTARELGLTSDEMAGYSTLLWGQSLSARRDQLAGDGANAQKRGRISRELKAELRELVENVTRNFDDQDDPSGDD